MIDYPNLEIRNEERIAAEAIARTTGALTVERIDSYLETFAQLRKIVAAGNLQPICPELTNANPSAPHTVILEAQAWLLAQMAYRINQIPEQNLIAFANLFGIEPRAATQAKTILRFTHSAAPGGADITIPAGTQVSDASGDYIFETIEIFTAPGTSAGVADVEARRLITGHTLLAPNKLVKMIDSIAFVSAVTNPSAIDSGTETETLDATLDRVKRFQRRGERIVSVKDLEDAIRDEALDGTGIVRAFPFVESGNFGAHSPRAGHTTVIVMTANGENIDSIAQSKIALLLDQAIGNQFIYIVNPIFVEFNVAATVRLVSNSTQTATLTAIERNLRAFYAPSREQFGRAIYRSEIIAVIEGTAGVDRIESSGAPILASPLVDQRLTSYQLPKLVNVTINVV